MKVCVEKIAEVPFRREAMTILNDMRLKGQLCDAILCTKDGGRFQVHRSIMVTCSPYFRALFTSEFSSMGRTEVEIPGVTSHMLYLIIAYAYTRETFVDTTNVCELLAAADQFNVLGMVADCCRYLLDHMTVDNCIGIWGLAEHYNCVVLNRAAFRFMLSHFTEIVQKSNELLGLPLNLLKQALKSDELNISDEDIVWDVILKWVEHKPKERKVHLPELVRCIRLGLVSIENFAQIIHSHPFVGNKENDWPLDFPSLPTPADCSETPDDLANRQTFLKNFTIPRIPHNIMFCVGGWIGDGPTDAIEVYDARADAWTTCKSVEPSGPRAYHKCAVIGFRMYVVGGTDGAECLNSCKCFDALSKTWKEVSPMYYKRCYLSLAVLDHIIYAMGGYDGVLRLQSAEKYDYIANQWLQISPMRYQRSDSAAAVVQGFIYVAGGFNGSEYLNSVEYYDKNYDIWTSIAPMNSRRSGVSCISYADCLYAVGGFNGIYRLETAEKYNPKTKTWGYVEDMCKKRSNFAIETIDGAILVSGGFDGVTTVNDAERYDPVKNRWKCIAPMVSMRSALAACVISGLPNVRDYVPAERAKRKWNHCPASANESCSESDIL